MKKKLKKLFESQEYSIGFLISKDKVLKKKLAHLVAAARARERRALGLELLKSWNAQKDFHPLVNKKPVVKKPPVKKPPKKS